MPENTSRIELHGCLVCGRLYNLLVVTTSEGKIAGCRVMDPNCHTISRNGHLLVACNEHKEGEVEAALARYHPGPERAEDQEEDECN